jgi:hypothetical protein
MQLLLLLLLLLYSKTLQQPGQSVHCHPCSLQSSACNPQQQQQHQEPDLCLPYSAPHKAAASVSQLTAAGELPQAAAGAWPQQSLSRVCAGTHATLLLTLLRRQTLCLHPWPGSQLQQTPGMLLLLLLLRLHLAAVEVQQLSARAAVKP